MKRISKKEAQRQGLTEYFTTRRCFYGHLSPRDTATGECIQCRKEAGREPTLESFELIGQESYPCERCAFQSACTERLMSCEAYGCYLNGEPWQDEPREPSRRMYGFLFGVAA